MTTEDEIIYSHIQSCSYVCCLLKFSETISRVSKMILNVRFVGSSLLYGYSCMWFFIQLVFPSIGWPKFSDTRNHYLLLDIPRFRIFMKRFKKSRLNFEYFTRAFSIMRLLEALSYIAYLAAIILINLEVQKSILKEFGIEQESELSYKAVYYVPLLHRVCLFFITTISVFVLRTKEWSLYDKYDIFSVEQAYQIQLFIAILLIALPDGLFGFVEARNFLLYVKPDKYFLVKVASGAKKLIDASVIGISIQSFLTVTNILSYSFRYKPLLNIIYASNCVQMHLANINDQLVVSSILSDNRVHGTSSLSTNLDESTYVTLAGQSTYVSSSLWSVAVDADGIQKKQTTLLDPSPSHFRLSSSPDHSASVSTKSSNQARIDSSRSGSSFQQVESTSSSWIPSEAKKASQPIYTSSTAQTTSRSTNLSVKLDPILLGPTSDSALALARNSSQQELVSLKLDKTETKTDRSIWTIRNLHQIEYHLTKLSFFVGDMDRCAASIVFSMCFLTFIQFIYSVFFMIEFSKNSTRYVHMLLGTICVSTQLSIPLCLFVSGDRMEKEAKRLLANLEAIYLEDRSQSLIYKQYGSTTMAALARTIKLLKTIKFDCDTTLRINLGTLKKFLLYSVTTMFIVIQYDALNAVPYQQVGASLNTTTSLV